MHQRSYETLSAKSTVFLVPLVGLIFFPYFFILVNHFDTSIILYQSISFTYFKRQKKKYLHLNHLFINSLRSKVLLSDFLII